MRDSRRTWSRDWFGRRPGSPGMTALGYPYRRPWRRPSRALTVRAQISPRAIPSGYGLEQAKIPVEVDEGRGVALAGRHADDDRFQAIIFALVQASAAAVADAIGQRWLAGQVVHPLALLAGAAPAQALNNFG